MAWSALNNIIKNTTGVDFGEGKLFGSQPSFLKDFGQGKNLFERGKNFVVPGRQWGIDWQKRHPTAQKALPFLAGLIGYATGQGWIGPAVGALQAYELKGNRNDYAQGIGYGGLGYSAGSLGSSLGSSLSSGYTGGAGTSAGSTAGAASSGESVGAANLYDTTYNWTGEGTTSNLANSGDGSLMTLADAGTTDTGTIGYGDYAPDTTEPGIMERTASREFGDLGGGAPMNEYFDGGEYYGDGYYGDNISSSPGGGVNSPWYSDAWDWLKQLYGKQNKGMLLGTLMNAGSKMYALNQSKPYIDPYQEAAKKAMKLQDYYSKNPDVVYNSPDYQAALDVARRASRASGAGTGGGKRLANDARLASMITSQMAGRNAGLVNAGAGLAGLGAQMTGQAYGGAGETIGNYPMNQYMLQFLQDYLNK